MENKFQQAHAKPIPLTSEQKAAYPIIYSELFLKFMQSAKQLAPQLQKEHHDNSLTPEAVAVAGLVGYDLEEPKFNEELLTRPILHDTFLKADEAERVSYCI